jgi:hypothetical protein
VQREGEMIQSIWVGIVGGGLGILIGLYSLWRSDSVAKWLISQGVPYTPDPTAQLRQIRFLGILFILAGGYCLFLTIRNF